MATGYQYDSFGAPTQSGSSNSYPYLFAGREWSDPLNLMQLYYNSARNYSPGLHRFISRDPAGLAGSGANLYAYVGDDPVNSTDPTGLGFIGLSIAFGDLAEGGGELGVAVFFQFAGSYSTADYDPPNGKPKPVFQPSSGAGAAQKTGCTPQKAAFVNANKTAATQIGNQLNVPAANILGLSASESRYGTSHIANNCHNYFGIHMGGVGSTGPCKANKSVSGFSASNGFLKSGEAFAARYGSAVSGIKDPSAFASSIPPNFNARGVGGSGNPNFNHLVTGTIKGVTPCLP
jgi:RHS repeat-associated protein